MKAEALITVLLLSVNLSAANDSGLSELKLWPNGSPGNETNLAPEKDTTKETDDKVGGQRLIRLGNVSEPTIKLFPAPRDKANGAAVLVCPGGAYYILAMDLEGTEVCARLNEMGITAILLKYRVPRRANQEKHLAPLQDAERAMGLIRQHAADWNIDPRRIGVLGFSAGGHLAAMVSNAPEKRNYPRIDEADDLEIHPNFSILIYPAYLTADQDRSRLAPELHISNQTPPSFIVMAQDDPVHVENALTYATALNAHKVPFALHIYPTGGHGYGLRKTAEPITRWPDRLEEWFISRHLDRK